MFVSRKSLVHWIENCLRNMPLRPHDRNLFGFYEQRLDVGWYFSNSLKLNLHDERYISTLGTRQCALNVKTTITIYLQTAEQTSFIN